MVIQEIQKQRLKGKTYSEIQQAIKIKIPKPTLSYWCRNIRLPKNYKKRIQKENIKHLKQIRKLALIAIRTKQKKRREGLVKKNVHLLKQINQPIKKIMLSILYLGEGAKYESSRMLTLGSSDPEIIQFYLALLKSCYNIENHKFRVRIQCRFDQNKTKLENFWKRTTGISPRQFYPTYVDKRTIGKPTKKKKYMGVCTIHYFNTTIQLELELLAKEIIKQLICAGPIV